jgi:hypothetical protein
VRVETCRPVYILFNVYVIKLSCYRLTPLCILHTLRDATVVMYFKIELELIFRKSYKILNFYADLHFKYINLKFKIRKKGNFCEKRTTYYYITTFLYYIKNQQDATLAVLFISNCKNTLYVSDVYRVHHQEY